MAIDKIISASVTDANVTTAKVANDAITLAKMASGTDGNIISYDASGNPVAVATGSSGQVLTSAGAGAVPSFATASSAEAGIPYWRAYKQGNQTLSNNVSTEITFNHDEDPYSGFASNKFIVPSGKGGLYLLGAAIMYSTNTTGGSMRMSIRVGVSNNPGAGTVESGMSHGGTYTSTTGSVLRTLSEGAYVSLYVLNVTGGDIVAYGTTGTVNFWGTRIK